MELENDNLPLPSLDYKTRSIIDDFNLWCDKIANKNITLENVIKIIMRKYNITYYEVRKIFKSELDVDIGDKKSFYTKQIVVKDKIIEVKKIGVNILNPQKIS